MSQPYARIELYRPTPFAADVVDRGYVGVMSTALRLVSIVGTKIDRHLLNDHVDPSPPRVRPSFVPDAVVHYRPRERVGLRSGRLRQRSKQSAVSTARKVLGVPAVPRARHAAPLVQVQIGGVILARSHAPVRPLPFRGEPPGIWLASVGRRGSSGVRVLPSPCISEGSQHHSFVRRHFLRGQLG